MNWNEYFMSIAKTVALKSKDQSTKNGVVIVGPDNEIRSTGYNGFCRGMGDDDPAKHERPLKYKFFEHAERNAIYNAARFGAPTRGCKMYSTWPPCTDCARAIIQSGITAVTSIRVSDCPERWWGDMIAARQMLTECGVQVDNVDAAVAWYNFKTEIPRDMTVSRGTHNKKG